MKWRTAICVFGCTALVCALLGSAISSEAKRFGGGRSFGSGSSFKFFNKKNTPSFGTSKSSKTKSPLSTAQRRTGGGLLGGLLMGGLIGSLFMGGPFMGPNLFDLLIIGGIIFLLVRVFSRRRTAVQTSPSPRGPFVSSPRDVTQDSREFWSRLRSTDAGSSGKQTGASPPPPPDAVHVDEDEFLKGAKAVYLRLQQAWDKRELEDIQQFVTPDFYQEITRQAKEDPEPGQTEIVLVNARFLGAKTENKLEQASVFFDVLLREDPSRPQSHQVQEVWNFVRQMEGADRNWKLDGIEQVDEST